MRSAPAAAEMEASLEKEASAFRDALVSPSTQRAVGDSLDRLKQSALDHMDARVEQVLRPMLLEWLDDNLPRMVENMVRAEIRRIAGEK